VDDRSPQTRQPLPPREADAPDRGPLDRPPPKKRIDALNFNTRVALLDNAGRLIIGNPNVPRDSPSVAVKSDGTVVGSLLLAPLPALESDADVAFAAAQTRHALTAAAGVLIGALLLAWVLARWLLEPVKALGAGSQRLAAGDYSVRIKAVRGDELGQLAADFNRLAAALEENRQARRQWGADIAHELRTPLSILRGEIQALQDGVRPLGPGALISLQAECGRMTALVEDLYQLSLSDAGALEYRFMPVDLGALLDSIVLEQRAGLESAGLTLTFEVTPATSAPAVIDGDERRLGQLFANLLTNARRYTESPGKVRIELSARAGAWCITVDDTPPGVAPQHLPKLFDRLYRVESSRSRSAGGAGLGLAICRNIVEAHQGRIEASTSPLGGLRVTIQLPAKRATA
jgi:two-component system sensor histidine kinase BaeS